MRRLLGPLSAIALPAVALLALFGAPILSGGPTPAVAAGSVPAQQIGMKVLLITDSTDTSTAAGIAYSDWVNTLKREGVPYDSVLTNDSSVGSVPLPALSSTASGGTEVANYEGVVVATSGSEGLSPAQWSALQTFEQHFSVRQVTAYVSPSSDYGFTNSAASPPATFSGSPSPVLTADGAKTLPYLNKVDFDPATFGYEGTLAAGANVDTLISGPGSSTLLGVYTTPDGRQTMFQTFNENPFMLQSDLLRHGELAWLARNTYFGDQRNYLETHIDDNFLADDSWSVAGNATTAAHSTDFNAADASREVPADVTKAATWSAANKFRIDMLFNGGGSVQYANGCIDAAAGDTGTGGTTTGCSTSAPGSDPLLAAFQANDPSSGKPYTGDFGWVSHTWDHPNLDEGCATQNFIEAELNQNTNWGAKAASTGDPTTGGLGLSVSASTVLGAENPNVIVTGEHSGLANLIPGNPGQVDPPALDTANPLATGGTLPSGQYVYAVSDQFNTAAPGATSVAGTGESAGSVSAPVTVTGPAGSVQLSWAAVCHAADYKIYRAPVSGTTIGTWSHIGTVQANTATDFTNPSSTNPTTSADNGGGAGQKTYTDTGSAGTAGAPLTAGTAVESAYEQNPNLDAAFAGTINGGIKYFGSDASKPYPSPANGAFSTGSYSGSQTPAGATFPDTGGTAVPRYPTNIFYNVSTNAQEVDEYQTIYDSPTCKPLAGVTTCNAAGTAFTIGQIIASVDQGMFQHMMGNDPRPHYFHQTNLMAQTTGSVTGQGSGLFYETLDPLLTQYHQYFAGNAPIEQATMADAGTLLGEQAGWAAANGSQVTGNIVGNVVTIKNGGTAIEVPLTGTEVGSAYAGGQSGWTLAPSGTSTHTALTAWPPPPAVPAVVTPPTGPAPATGPGGLPGPAHPPASPGGPTVKHRKATTIASIVSQVPPKTVSIHRDNTVTASLRCKAAKGTLCVGKFTLSVKGRRLTAKFRIKAGKIARIGVPMPRAAMTASHSRQRKIDCPLVISTTQSHSRKVKITRGKLTITP